MQELQNNALQPLAAKCLAAQALNLDIHQKLLQHYKHQADTLMLNMLTYEFIQQRVPIPIRMYSQAGKTMNDKFILRPSFSSPV